MKESDGRETRVPEAGRDTLKAQSSTLGGGWSDARISASVLSSANEGSRDKRHPLLWAAAWFGGVAGVIAALILILR